MGGGREGVLLNVYLLFLTSLDRVFLNNTVNKRN